MENQASYVYIDNLLRSVMGDAVDLRVFLPKYFNKDYYHFITYRKEAFCSLMEEILNTYKLPKVPKFLEIGSGIGINCWIANVIFNMQATGIEVSKELYGYSKIAFHKYPKIHFININALKYKHYSKFNIIYSFLPIKKEEMMIGLYQKIFDSMKKDSLLIEGYYQDDIFGEFAKNNSLEVFKTEQDALNGIITSGVIKK
jgi:hypothetical protein